VYTEGKLVNQAIRNSDMNRHQEVCELADQYVEEAMANGEAYSEILCEWAMTKAMEELGG
jgi:hypothetical protein